jgi:hypothetical protein
MDGAPAFPQSRRRGNLRLCHELLPAHNLYHHGGEGMGWHSDDEGCLAEGSPILSLSFGAARKSSISP